MIVKDGKQLNTWYKSLKNDAQVLDTIKSKARIYTNNNTGATDNIIQMIKEHVKYAL